MHFDGTVTLGDLLHIGATLGAILVAYFKLRERMVAIETKLEPLWGWYNRRATHRRVEDAEDA